MSIENHFLFIFEVLFKTQFNFQQEIGVHGNRMTLMNDYENDRNIVNGIFQEKNDLFNAKNIPDQHSFSQARPQFSSNPEKLFIMVEILG